MPITVIFGIFEWDSDKEGLNVKRHRVTFETATLAFLDSNRIIAVDSLHSEAEPRKFCIGKAGNRVVTVRFTLRGNRIRIIGAGYWRKGKKIYEKERSKKSR